MKESGEPYKAFVVLTEKVIMSTGLKKSFFFSRQRLKNISGL